MKLLIFTLLMTSFLPTHAQVAHVFGAGQALVGQNDDETLLVITGPAAEAMYHRLYVPTESLGTGWLKRGNHYSCQLDAPVKLRRYSCHFFLEELSTSRGSLLSGSIAK